MRTNVAADQRDIWHQQQPSLVLDSVVSPIVLRNHAEPRLQRNVAQVQWEDEATSAFSSYIASRPDATVRPNDTKHAKRGTNWWK